MVSKLKPLGGYSLVCVYLYMGMCLIALLLLSFMTNNVEYIYIQVSTCRGRGILWRPQQAAQLLRHAIVVDMPCDTAISQNKPNEGENLYLL